MKRTSLTLAVIALFLLASAAISFADTVLVFIDDRESDRFLTNALEAGVMDHLFFSGHIVFNGSLSESGSANQTDIGSQYVALAAGRTGGADLVLQLRLESRRVNTTSTALPEEASFVFMDVGTDRVIGTGNVGVSEVERGEDDMDPGEIAFALGRVAAERALAVRGSD